MFETVPPTRVGFTPWREMTFVPAIEIEEKENKLFVKADLPGLKKEDVRVEVAVEGVTITGERKEAKEERKRGTSGRSGSMECSSASFRCPKGPCSTRPSPSSRTAS